MSQRLRSGERIRKRPEFQRVYDSGAKVHGRFMTVFAAPNGSPVARLGVAATRRIGSAVIRNRAKRLARELFRRYKLATGLDVIVVPRREMLDAPFASLEVDFDNTIRRCTRGKTGPARAGSGRRNRRDKSV